MMRHFRKQRLTILGALRAGFAIVLIALSLIAPRSASAIEGRYITDPLSGVAIYGLDPVSYFTESEPLSGRPEFSHEWGGVTWLFANAANRDVFVRAPEIYAPRFGGYGLMALARGYLSEGNPRIYAILGGQLFFFYSTANRDAFMLSQRASYLSAAANWNRLSADLVKS